MKLMNEFLNRLNKNVNICKILSLYRLIAKFKNLKKIIIN